MNPQRLDQLLVQLGLAESRTRAQALILRGDVLVDDVPMTHAGHRVRSRDIRVRRRPTDDYVSRGAFKLLGGLDAFKIVVQDKLAVDIGASTGGFTQVLLERGAKKVVALDVGKGLLAWSLRTDPRVHLIEGTNARHLDPRTVTQALGGPLDLIVIDVSFISLELILPKAVELASCSTSIVTLVALIKPQFEVGPSKVGKGGIVRDESARQDAVRRVLENAKGLGLEMQGLIESPISGTKGNREFLAHFVCARSSPKRV